MSENIAGYIDRSYVKGQTYRLAGCPRPLTSTGIDINTISSDLLVKALYVDSTRSSGTFPGLGVFLITTVEYGNSTYLQTAISLSTGYEYRRIKSGTNSWTEWKDSSNGSASVDLSNLTSRVDGILSVDGTSGEIPTIKNSLATIGGEVQTASNNASTAWNMANSANQAVNNLSSRLSITDVSTSYGISKGGGSWSVVSKQFYKIDNFLYMRISFKGNGSAVNAGSNGFTGAIIGPQMPVGLCHLIGFYSSSTIIVLLNGFEITARVTGAKATLSSSSNLSVSGIVMLSQSNLDSVTAYYENGPEQSTSHPALSN